jgi:hypothetical protein
MKPSICDFLGDISYPNQNSKHAVNRNGIATAANVFVRLEYPIFLRCGVAIHRQYCQKVL